MGNLMLEELIAALEKMPKDAVVEHGFGEPHSDRGDYSNLAFEPAENVTIGSMLAHAKEALGKSFVGYKGGDYLMHECVDVLIGKRGMLGENITSTHIRMWKKEAQA